MSMSDRYGHLELAVNLVRTQQHLVQLRREWMAKVQYDPIPDLFGSLLPPPPPQFQFNWRPFPNPVGLDVVGYGWRADPGPDYSSSLQSQMRMVLPARAAGKALAAALCQVPGLNADPVSKEDYFLGDLERIAKEFKQRRLVLGFTQADVAYAIAKRTGNPEFSQTNVSRFEGMNLSHPNMCKMVPVMTGWLQDTENLLRFPEASSKSVSANVDNSAPVVGVVVPPKKQRKGRTSIPKHLRAELETEFSWKPKPSKEERVLIADRLSLPERVVNVWFANRWQRDQRGNPMRKRASKESLAATTNNSLPENPEI